MKDFEKEFQRVKKFRFLPVLPILIFGGFGLIKYSQGNEGLGFIFITIAFIGCFYLASKYKCPNCKYVLDARISSSNLNHCPKCGVKLQSAKFYRH